MILDEDSTVDIALRLKAHNLKIDRASEEGDLNLLEELQGQFYDKIARFLRSAVIEFAKGANDHDQDDLIQDSFLKILRNINSFKPRKGKIHSWMTMIVKNLCIDWGRKKRPELGLPDIVFETADAPSIERELDPESFDTLKAFFPFFASDKLIFELLVIVDKFQYRASGHCIKTITKLLAEHEIDYTEYGKPRELTEAIIIVLRGLLLTPMTDRTEIIMENLKRNPRFDTLRILTYFLGPMQTAQLVLLFGGMQIQLPSPQQFFRVTDDTR